MRHFGALLWSLFAGLLVLGLCLYALEPSGLARAGTVRSTAVNAPPSRSKPLYETFIDHRRREWSELSRHGFNPSIPKNAYANAISQRLRMEAIANSGTNAAAPAVAGTWTFIGPQPMKGQKANFTGDLFGPIFNASGRVSAIAIDPSGNIYVGTAGGGVWLSKNHGASFSWISKALPTQSIGSIGIDVTNTNPPTVYVGTGEGNSAVDTYYGLGLWSTQDFGAHWTQVNPSNIFSNNGAFQAFTTLLMPCDHLFAATGNGLSSSRGVSNIDECEPTIFATGFDCMQGAIYESRPPSPGSTWHRTFGVGNRQDRNGGPVRSLAIGAIINPDFSPQPAMFATIDGLGIVTTQDNTGIPFTCGSTTPSPFDVLGTLPFSSVGRSSVATGNPNNDTQIYAIIGNSGGSFYNGFISSGAGGASWSLENTPCAATADQGATWSTSPADCGADGFDTIDGNPASPANGSASSQAFYDQALAVWPKDKLSNTVYFGGVGIYRTTDGGSTWNFLGQNGGTHADAHAIAFDPTDLSKVYVGNDGGVYRLDTATDQWTSLNDSINSGQIYGIGPHPTDNKKVLAGFQDNGVQLYTGNLGWDFSFTADGGFTAFDRNDPGVAYMDIDSNGRNVPQMFASKNGGTAGTWLFMKNLAGVMAANNDVSGSGKLGGARFIAPFAVDPAVAHRLVVGGHLLYVTTNADAGPDPMGNSTANFALMSAQNLAGCNGGCAITDIEFAPSDHTVLYTVASQGFNSTTNFPFKVFVSKNANLNAGVTFTDITGGLPFDSSKTQATSIAVSPFDPKVAYLGISGFNSNTMIVTPPAVGHIFKTVDMGAHWTEADNGLPDVPVLKLIVDRTDKTGNTVM